MNLKKRFQVIPLTVYALISSSNSFHSASPMIEPGTLKKMILWQSLCLTT